MSRSSIIITTTFTRSNGCVINVAHDTDIDDKSICSVVLITVVHPLSITTRGGEGEGVGGAIVDGIIINNHNSPLMIMDW